MATNTKDTTQKQTMNVYHVKDDPNGGKGRWLRIGTAFTHDDFKGFNVLLDSIPLNWDGRLTIRDRDEQK